MGWKLPKGLWKIQNSYNEACKVESESEDMSISQVIKSLADHADNFRFYSEATKKPPKDVSKEVNSLHIHFKNEFLH